MKRPVFINYIVLLIVSLSSCVSDVEIVDRSAKDDTEHIRTAVSMEEARLDLESLLNDIDASYSRGNDVHLHRKIKSSYSVPIYSSSSRAEEADMTLIHVFNFENNEGYAIMSGDKRLPSLISLCDSGTLEEEEEIDDPGVAMFLEGVDNMYLERKQNDLCDYEDDCIVGGGSNSYSYSEYGAWENIVYNQYGVCPVKWGQGSPYNKYCPIKDNSPTYTGCVATAVAQLMAIYKFPESYDNYSFSWEDMTYNKYGSYCSSKGQDDIAMLMKQLGLKKNLDTSYGNNSSGAKTENIMRTLKSFGYSQPGTLKDYKTSEVIEDLKKGYGVLICGYSNKTITRFIGIKIKTKYSGGHQWLAHGLLERRREIKRYNSCDTYIGSYYESLWYPLCNWGWGGSRDGYYLSEAFDTNSGCVFHEEESTSRSGDLVDGMSDYNFQFKISAITGIRK